MSYNNRSYLDQFLKDLNDNTIWDNERKQNIRTQIHSEINQINNSTHSNLKFWIRKFVPILALLMFFTVSSILYLNEINSQNYSYYQKNQGNSENSVASNDDNASDLDDFQFKIDEQTETKIQEIKDSGFDLRLPQRLPVDNTEIENIKKREAMSGYRVRVFFQHHDQEVFEFGQESISKEDRDRAEKIKQEVKSNANDQFKIGDHSGYVTNENDKNTINIYTKNYAFSIFSSKLTKEQLIQIAKSINLEKLGTLHSS